MIHINNQEILSKLKKENDFCVIIDFDRTITTADSTPTMGIVPEFLGGKIQEKRTELYNYYRPIELDYTLDLDERSKMLKEWTYKSLNVLSEYINSEEVIKESIIDANLHLRLGAKEFFKNLKDRNVPVIIMSAGMGNVIKAFLEKEEILFDNIILINNFFEFKESKAYIKKEKIVATSNKEYNILPEEIKEILEKKKNILLCGDIVEDIKMIDKNLRNKTLTIGFLDKNIDSNLKIYNKNFDIVLSDNETFETINELLKEEV